MCDLEDQESTKVRCAEAHKVTMCTLMSVGFSPPGKNGKYDGKHENQQSKEGILHVITGVQGQLEEDDV